MSSAAIATGRSSVLRNARAALGVSTTQCPRVRATASVRAGSTSATRNRTEQVRHQVQDAAWRIAHGSISAGNNTPSSRSSRDSAISGRPINARRVVAVDPLEQHDAERLRTHGAGAVVGPLAQQVALDLVASERAERAGHIDEHVPAAARGRIHERQRRMEHDRAARLRGELGHGHRVGFGLADGHAVAIGHLVRADDQRAGVPRRHGACLCLRQPDRGCRRRFAGPRRFVDLRRHDGERQLQPLQQHSAIARRRREDQRRSGVPHCFCGGFLTGTAIPAIIQCLRGRPNLPNWSQPTG